MRSARGSFKEACHFKELPLQMYAHLLPQFNGDSIRVTEGRSADVLEFFKANPEVCDLAMDLENERTIIIEEIFIPTNYNRMDYIK